MTHHALLVAGLSVVFIASARASVETSKDSSATMETAAAVVNQRDACEAAMPGYIQALKNNSENAKLHNRLGVCQQHLGRDGDARRAFRRATELDPRYAEAWNNLGTTHHATRDFKRAIKHYRRAIKIRPDMAVAHRNLGTALLALGKTKEGFNAYLEAYKIDSTIFQKNAELLVGSTGDSAARQYYFFAKLSARAGHIDAALEFLRKARVAGYRDFDDVHKDPDFEGVVQNERFTSLFE